MTARDAEFVRLASLKSRLTRAAGEYSSTSPHGWRGVYAYQAAAAGEGPLPSLVDVARLLDELVIEGVLERRPAPGGYLWRVQL